MMHTDLGGYEMFKLRFWVKNFWPDKHGPHTQHGVLKDGMVSNIFFNVFFLGYH